MRTRDERSPPPYLSTVDLRGKQSRVSYRAETMVQSSQPSVVSITLYQITWTMRFRCAFCAPPSTPLVFRSFAQLKYIVTHRYGRVQRIPFVVIGSYGNGRRNSLSLRRAGWRIWNTGWRGDESVQASIKYKTRPKFFDNNGIKASRDDATTRIGGRRWLVSRLTRLKASLWSN